MGISARETLAVKEVHLENALGALRRAIALEMDGDLADCLTEAAANVAEIKQMTGKRLADLAEADARHAPTEQEK